MERVYAEYDLYLQVRQRKNLTSAWEHTNAENVSGERAVKAPYELPHVSGIVQRPREAIIFRLFYQLKATVYLRASKTPAETAELLCKALVRPRRRLSNRWSPQAPQPDSGPDAACEWPHVPSFYSSIVSFHTFLWQHQGTCVCFYVWQEDLSPEALCVCVCVCILYSNYQQAISVCV